MGSDQSALVPPSSSSKPRAGTGAGDAKNFAYLSPIGSQENVNAAGDGNGAGGGAAGLSPMGGERKRNSASSNERVSPSTDPSRAPTLQAQLQAKVSAGVVSGVATATQKLDAASALIGRSSASGKAQAADAIVVVHSGKVVKEETVDDDVDLKRMRNIPVCYPLLKPPANLSPNEKAAAKQKTKASPPEPVFRLNYKEALVMGVRYQEHLRRCADAVAFDQNSLCTRVKEIDFAVNTLMTMLTERQKKYAKLAEQVAKTSDILQSVRSIRSTVDGLIPILNDVNFALPPELRLEQLPSETQPLPPSRSLQSSSSFKRDSSVSSAVS